MPGTQKVRIRIRTVQKKLLDSELQSETEKPSIQATTSPFREKT
jgi:hypothetical protein